MSEISYPFPLDPIAACSSAEGVTQMCDAALSRANQLMTELRNVSDAGISWDTTFGRFDAIIQSLQESTSLPQLLSVVHPDATVRDAARACEPTADRVHTALLMDDGIASVLMNASTKLTDLAPERARFIKHVLRDYRRNGLSLDADGRARLKALNEEITTRSQQFDTNIASTILSISIYPEQLDGLPQSYIECHPVNADGLVVITTDYPDYFPFLRYATDRVAARELCTLFNNRAAETNLPILDELIRLRSEKAHLLGYPTWAAYVLEPRMATSPEIVRSFIGDLHRSLKPLRDKEFALFRDEAKTVGLVDEPVSAADATYLEDRIIAKKFTLDTKRLSEYFQVDAVRDGIMAVASKMYQISFEPVNAPVWHEDVHPFEVRDNTTGEVLGRVFLDLYPREEKYKHAAVFEIREAVCRTDGSRVLPLAALVCNFSKPGSSPALLSHEEVTTFFHEFGHLLHHVFSMSTLARYAGTNVERDFVEAPSQIFEEWGWSHEVVDSFAKHYETGEKIPTDLFEALLASRRFGESVFTERQLLLAMLDQVYATRDPGFGTTAVLEEVHAEFSPFARVPGTHFQASFGHLVGYDAAYYGYQWARSIAFDLFTRFQNEGMMNARTAREYRERILSRGGMADGAVLAATFLGRPLNAGAYKHYLGML